MTTRRREIRISMTRQIAPQLCPTVASFTLEYLRRMLTHELRTEKIRMSYGSDAMLSWPTKQIFDKSRASLR
uniref:Uncharacterized protein n=1 Tax=Caenorhabditis japonica TaxID=281687 RepID=A0A8R1EBT3_CAEJA